ncbi:MAG: alpha/beta hydrolase [Chitinophagaceae bacterium]|nr:alpha/beta hydrolase [Chitinophagaceae bacterium]
MKIQNFAVSVLKTQINLLAAVSKRRAGNKAFDIFCTPYLKKTYIPNSFFKSAEELLLDFEGLNTIGYRWNKGGEKRILIAHGFKSCAENFGHFVKLFIKKNYEVIAFDAPAHGRSQGKILTGIIYKNFIATVYNTYGPFDSFLGHSFGAMGIIFFAAELPENKDLKIALVAPASDTLSLSNMFFNQMKIKDKEVQKYFIKRIETLGKHPIEWFSIKRCLETINSQVLWVHDKFDRITPVKDAYIVQKLKLDNVQFIFTERLGHRKIYRDEKVVKNIVDFL